MSKDPSTSLYSDQGSAEQSRNGRKSQPIPERFRWWVILLGMVLIPLNSVWIARAEALDYSGFPTCASLFYNVIFSLIILLLLNTLIRRVLPSIALSRQELLVVYGMVATGSSLVGHDFMEMLVPTIPHASYMATPENQWGEMIVPHLPTWLTINTVNDSIRAYETGRSTLYLWEHIRIWIVPISAWSVFLVALIMTMLSINLLLRRHWIEHERLSYPIAQIPILMTEGGGSNPLFKSRLFWLGFVIAAGLDLWNGFAQLYPSMPFVNLKLWDLTQYLPPRPWQAMGWTPISFYPFVIGLSFFMPTSISFSSWFFFLFRKAEMVAASAMGYDVSYTGFPYVREQAYGAWLALFGASLWFGRRYLKEVWTAAWTGKGVTDDGGVSYRGAFIMLGIGGVVMFAFLVAMGMTWWVAATYLILYLTLCGAVTRMRAELGPPAHEIALVSTTHMMVMALGTALLGPKNLALFSLLWFQNRTYRGLLMPQQAESMKAASASGLRMRTMFIALLIAGVVGVFAAFWAHLHVGYGRPYHGMHPGAPGSGFANEHYNQLMAWFSTPMAPSTAGLTAVGIGAAVTMALARLTVAFHGFPFHPAGYALGMAFGLEYIWMPVLISWFLKVMILRYSGLKGYRTAVPFFVGLVLGEFLVGGMWSFLRGVLGVQTYTFFY